jgi:hypothetical protein
MSPDNANLSHKCESLLVRANQCLYLGQGLLEDQRFVLIVQEWPAQYLYEALARLL